MEPMTLAWLLAATALTPAAVAQVTPDEPIEMIEPDGPDITVTGQPPRGSVPGDIPPEQVLTQADVRAYGVSSIAELLTELAPQTSSGRGRGDGGPVVLLGGRRISGLREIRDIPTEAIERVDILPEEAALKYGYRADQRVVNIVLRRRFRAITAELEGNAATGGGQAGVEGDLDILRLDRDGRVTLGVDFEQQGALLESERGIGSDDRTLLPWTRDFSVTGTVNRLIGSVSATANLGLDVNDSRALLGSDVDRMLERNSHTRAGHAGAALNGDLGGWRWAATGNYDRTITASTTDRVGFRDMSQSVTDSGAVDLLLSGSPFSLPAGNVGASVRATVKTSDLSSRSRRGGVVRTAAVGRDGAGVQANLDVPLTSRKRDVLSAVGDITLNANVEVEGLSDVGQLRTTGYGVNWSPLPAIRLIFSVTDEAGAPTPQQLTNPSEATPNIRVFDLATGQSVDITRIDGGNPFLRPDDRHVMKLGANVKPFSQTDLRISADYIRSTIRNPISGFPTATPAIEAAFPGRFVRDGSGTLVSIDNRPVNFLRSDTEQLRWGINLSLPLKSKNQQRFDAMRAARQAERDLAEREGRPVPERAPGARRRWQGGGGGGGGPRSAGSGSGGGRGGDLSGRIQFSLYHTLALTDTLRIAPGVPTLDLLDGDATGSRGGSPRHQLELRAGYARDGIGLRVNADWQSATTVRGGTGDLHFADFATVGLRVFADMNGQVDLVRKHRWLRGVRVSLGVDNVFDARLRVTDATGATPANYRPDLLDPLGRSVKLSIRKLFF